LVKLLVVPVLPAAGRPISAAVPVPLWITPRRTSVTVSATVGAMTWVVGGLVVT
jgi:hypothetical protein